MAYKTVQSLTQDILNELSLVPGTSVQTYAEPAILNAINTCFQTLFKMRFWGHLTSTTEHEVDSASGLITDTLVSVDDVDDIDWVIHYPFNERDRLEFLAGKEWQTPNKPAYDELIWNHDQRVTKLIQMYPFDIPSPVRIRARRKVDPFIQNSDVVPFDDVCMKHFCTMNILATDGINPNAQQHHSVLFNSRYETLTSAAASKVSEYSRGRDWDSGFTVAE